MILKLVWAATFAAAGFACFFGYITISMASSAPQEASGAAMALLIAVGPYVIARSLTEILRG